MARVNTCRILVGVISPIGLGNVGAGFIPARGCFRTWIINNVQPRRPHHNQITMVFVVQASRLHGWVGGIPKSEKSEIRNPKS